MRSAAFQPITADAPKTAKAARHQRLRRVRRTRVLPELRFGPARACRNAESLSAVDRSYPGRPAGLPGGDANLGFPRVSRARGEGVHPRAETPLGRWGLGPAPVRQGRINSKEIRRPVERTQSRDERLSR